MFGLKISKNTTKTGIRHQQKIKVAVSSLRHSEFMPIKAAKEGNQSIIHSFINIRHRVVLLYLLMSSIYWAVDLLKSSINGAEAHCLLNLLFFDGEAAWKHMNIITELGATTLFMQVTLQVIN